MLLKCMGARRVGCAAGGHELDIRQLRRDPYYKPLIRNMVRRSWRVQGTFFIPAFLLPIWTGLLLKKGLTTLIKSLQEIQDINHDVSGVALRAMRITELLTTTYAKMTSFSGNQDALDLTSYCPLVSNSTFVQGTDTSSFAQNIRQSLSELSQFMEYEVASAKVGLSKVDQLTAYIDDAADWVFRHDWLCKLFVVVVNVVNLALLCGLLLSRKNIIFYPFKALLSFLLVPVFAIMTGISLLAACSTAMAAVLNADFCSGGEYPGSPEGTVEDIILKHGISTHDTVYRSFVYYMDVSCKECLSSWCQNGN